MNTVVLIPAVRCSTHADPEIRAYSDDAQAVRLEVLRDGESLAVFLQALTPGQAVSFRRGLGRFPGQLELRFSFLCGGEAREEKRMPYEVVRSDTPGTGLLDGCWISIQHWSPEESRYFRDGLAQMTDADFERHIEDMADAGIRGVVIQNLFDSPWYVGRHSLTCETYDGRAFYPSAMYPGRMPIRAQDPVEAVLRAADRCGSHVLVGIGLFAWFDFSAESLEWHKRVAREAFERYGNHPSFYGWYVSEELLGDLYWSYLPEQAQRWREVGTFFREFRAFVHTLDPVRPIAFAPNNVRFHEHEAEWKTILPYIDILLPFAFARDPAGWNVPEMKQICEDCGVHMWVDMEMFQVPFEDGLLPKEYGELVREIEQYSSLEQCYGYQYTGLMNRPGFTPALGGACTEELYERYRARYLEKQQR